MRSFLILVTAPLMLVAQTPAQPEHSGVTGSGHRIPVPSAVASHRTSPIVLDAKLDEPAWNAATPITSFTQVDPDEGKPATQRTEVRILYDDNAVYFGAKTAMGFGRDVRAS